MADYEAPDYIYLNATTIGLLVPPGLDPNGSWEMHDNKGNTASFETTDEYVSMSVSSTSPTRFMFANRTGIETSDYTDPIIGKSYPDVRMDKTDGTKFKIGGIPTRPVEYGYRIYSRSSGSATTVFVGEIAVGDQDPFVHVTIREEEQLSFMFYYLRPPVYPSEYSPYYSGFVKASPPSDLRREGDFDSNEFVISWKNNETISDPYEDFLTLQVRAPYAPGDWSNWMTAAAVDKLDTERQEARFTIGSEWHNSRMLEFRVYAYTVVSAETLYSGPLGNQFGRPLQHRLLGYSADKASVAADWTKEFQQDFENVTPSIISFDVMKTKDGVDSEWTPYHIGTISEDLFSTSFRADEAASYKIRTSVSYDMPDGVPRTTDPVETPPIEVGFAPEKPVVEYDKESFSASIVLPEDDTGSSPNKRTVKMYLNGNVSSEHLQEADSGHTIDTGKILPSSSFSLSAGVRTDFWPDEVMSEQVDIEFDGTALIVGDKRYGVYLIRYGEPVVPAAIHAI